MSTTAYTMTIDGKAVTSAASINAIDPATEQVIATVPDASREQLDQAVASARHALSAWAATPLNERRAVLGRIAGILAANAPTLGALLSLEQGKPLAKAQEEVFISAHW